MVDCEQGGLRFNKDGKAERIRRSERPAIIECYLCDVTDDGSRIYAITAEELECPGACLRALVIGSANCP